MNQSFFVQHIPRKPQYDLLLVETKKALLNTCNLQVLDQKLLFFSNVIDLLLVMHNAASTAYHTLCW